MHIITVIPIGRGIGKDTLTYFTREDVVKGSIVAIPIRGKRSYGLVIASEPAAGKKEVLKSLTFSIKKIEQVETQSFLTPAFIHSVEKIAEYSATTAGAVLAVLSPKTILESSAAFTYFPQKPPKKETGVHEMFYEMLLLQADKEERWATYKSLIREEFARGKSVMLILPTTEDIRDATETLQKGIESYTYTLHGGLSKKDVSELWQKISRNLHPSLIICTGSFLSLPRDDIGTMIVEKESSRAYHMQTRPYLDIRTAARIIAEVSHRRIIFGDNLLRIETIHKEKGEAREHMETGKAENVSALAPLKFRSLSSADCELVDMRTPKDFVKKEFEIFSEALKKILQRTKEKSERTFLFCGRKGLFPTTVCSDCGTVVACHVCTAPVVL